MIWAKENEWERFWWNNCVNTYAEETKQFVYMNRMGVTDVDRRGQSVIDIGGGPVSFLLKCQNVKGYVVDPCFYPSWVWQRYEAAGIKYLQSKGEDFCGIVADEVWIYNCLQHTESPREVVQNARKHGNVVRIFEWIYTSVEPGHPHSLNQEDLDLWLGGRGSVEEINQDGCVGICYYGVFNA